MRLERKPLAELLPAIYRIRDRAEGEPLVRLLSVIAEQLEVLEDNAEQLYDDQFIETCAEWVVPYIGDLVGARGMRDVRSAGFSARAYIANTLASRRRKGTAAMLEQLSHDLTQWNAAAVEFFTRLAWTQWMNHIRKDCKVWLDLRDAAALEHLGTPFERAMRTVDVRRISSGRGLHNIPNVGIFLWRIEAKPLTDTPAVPGPKDGTDQLRWRFNPLGTDTPLYSHPEPEEEITHLATRVNVPMPISRRSLARDTSTWYGHSILVRLGGVPVGVENILSADLSDSKTGWEHMPVPIAGKLAIDPALGRLALPADAKNVAIRIGATDTPLTIDPNDPLAYDSPVAIPSKLDQYTILIGGVPVDPAQIRMIDEPLEKDERRVRIDVTKKKVFLNAPATPPVVSYHYGAVADIGGGEYEREASYSGINDPSGVLEEIGSGRHEQALSFTVAAATQFERRAGRESRPAYIMTGNATINGGDDAEIFLNGFVVKGGRIDVTGSPRRLCIRHCTFVPGSGVSLSIQTTKPLILEIESSILGPIEMKGGGGTLTLRDSIVDASNSTANAIGDGADFGPPSTIERCTIFGRVRVRELTLGSETIFFETVTVERNQSGCVRFSYLAPGSVVPRRYKCVGPEGAADVELAFTSTKYGDAAYAQLAAGTDAAIANGAESGSEMGVYCALESPRREANLRAAVQEYLRFGLEAGIFHVS